MLFNQRVMSSIPDNEAVFQPALAARQARRVALIVAVAFFMQLLDSTIISTSLPQRQHLPFSTCSFAKTAKLGSPALTSGGRLQDTARLPGSQRR